MDYSAIVRDYKALRAERIELTNLLVTMLSQDDLHAAARDLGMLREKEIDLGTRDEMCVLMDYAIHAIRCDDGRNAVDRVLLKNPPPEGSNPLRLLRSMQRSHYTIFEVQTPIPGVGVRGVAGAERTPILLVDMGLSKSAIPGLALATRIHSPGEGWWITTGAAMPMNHEAIDQIISGMESHRRRHGAELSEEDRTRLIVRSCISSGTSRQVRYTNPDEPDGGPTTTAPIRASSKVGRNDPCPCGSGRKHKKCCGT